MNRLARLASPSLLVAAALLAAPVAAGGLVKPKLPVPKIPDAAKEALPSPTSQPAPLMIGWPHTISTGVLGNCAREPAPHEVIVYDGLNFTGTCAVLTAGFYPSGPNLAIGDNKLSSIKVGSAVRARVYLHPNYTGRWNMYKENTRGGGLADFNDTVTSMRVEPGDRSPSCDDLRDGEFALFEHPHGLGDCVVLPASEVYPTPDTLGIGDDTVSSIYNNSARHITGFADPNFSSTLGIEVPPRSRNDALPTGGSFYNGIDDDISSVRSR